MNKCYFYIIFLSTLVLLSCSQSEPIPVDTNFNPDREIATDIETIYSDSAKLKFIVRAPLFETYMDKGVLVEEYPKGLELDFYDENEQISSSMKANYAERRWEEGTMLFKDNVVLSNIQNDELTTPGILWNFEEQTLKTNKLVKLIKGVSNDTLYGWGLEAKDDFTRFKIKKLTGKRHYESTEEP